MGIGTVAISNSGASGRGTAALTFTLTSSATGSVDLPGLSAIRARRLHDDLRAGRLDQQGQPTLTVRDQPQGALQARQSDPAGPGRQQVTGRTAHPHAAPLLVLNQTGQTGARVKPGQARELVHPARAREPGVQASLDVHPVIAGPRGPDHRHAGRLRTQMLPQRPLHRRIFGPRHRHRTPQQPPGQPADVRQLWAGLQVSRTTIPTEEE